MGRRAQECVERSVLVADHLGLRLVRAQAGVGQISVGDSFVCCSDHVQTDGGDPSVCSASAGLLAAWTVEAGYSCGG